MLPLRDLGLSILPLFLLSLLISADNSVNTLLVEDGLLDSPKATKVQTAETEDIDFLTLTSLPVFKVKPKKVLKPEPAKPDSAIRKKREVVGEPIAVDVAITADLAWNADRNADDVISNADNTTINNGEYKGLEVDAEHDPDEVVQQGVWSEGEVALRRPRSSEERHLPEIETAVVDEGLDEEVIDKSRTNR